MDNIDKERYEVVPIYITKDLTIYSGGMLRYIDSYKDKTIVFFGDSITDTCKMFCKDHPYGGGFVNMIKTELDVSYPTLNIKVYNELLKEADMNCFIIKVFFSMCSTIMCC